MTQQEARLTWSTAGLTWWRSTHTVKIPHKNPTAINTTTICQQQTKWRSIWELHGNINTFNLHKKHSEDPNGNYMVIRTVHLTNKHSEDPHNTMATPTNSDRSTRELHGNMNTTTTPTNKVKIHTTTVHNIINTTTTPTNKVKIHTTTVHNIINTTTTPTNKVKIPHNYCKQHYKHNNYTNKQSEDPHNYCTQHHKHNTTTTPANTMKIHTTTVHNIINTTTTPTNKVKIHTTTQQYKHKNYTIHGNNAHPSPGVESFKCGPVNISNSKITNITTILQLFHFLVYNQANKQSNEELMHDRDKRISKFNDWYRTCTYSKGMPCKYWAMWWIFISPLGYKMRLILSQIGPKQYNSWLKRTWKS